MSIESINQKLKHIGTFSTKESGLALIMLIMAVEELTKEVEKLQGKE